MDPLSTPRHALPLLATGQAHKEIFHNEAIVLLDFLANPVVLSIENDPNTLAPVEGECWLIGTSPVGVWSDHADHIAGWSNGGWRYIGPLESMSVHNLAQNVRVIFSAGSWQSLNSISGPTGGSVIDVESRIVIDSILAALELHGILPSQP